MLLVNIKMVFSILVEYLLRIKLNGSKERTIYNELVIRIATKSNLMPNKNILQ